MKTLIRQLGYLVGVVPFTRTTIGRYFLNIGLRYIPMVAIAAAIGYAWRKRAVAA